MDYGYANGNAKMAVSSQVEIIVAAFPKMDVAIEPKGSKDEWRAFFGKDVFLSRGKGHRIVVAEFHHLATNRDELAERVAAIHGLGSFVFEAKSGKSTQDPAQCPIFLLNAIYFYETGLSPERRSEIAAHAAKFSPVATIRTDRVPHKLAQEHLCNMVLTMGERITAINAIRDSKGKRYRRPWTKEFAYREKRARRIDFPGSAAGPPPKRT